MWEAELSISLWGGVLPVSIRAPASGRGPRAVCARAQLGGHEDRWPDGLQRRRGLRCSTPAAVSSLTLIALTSSYLHNSGGLNMNNNWCRGATTRRRRYGTSLRAE